MTNRTTWEGKLKPLGGLGRLESLVNLFVKEGEPGERSFENYKVVVMAADSGVSREDISIYPPMSSARIVQAHLDGTAAPSIFLRRIGREEILVDVGLFEPVDSEKVWNHRVSPGTRNFLQEPAMTPEEVVRAIESGSRVVERLEGLDIAGIGEVGVGNTVSSAAVLTSLLDVPLDKVIDRGSGVDDEVLARRADIITRALARHRPRSGDVLDILGKVGCFELAAMTGFIVRAGERRLPVMLDGYVACLAALLAVRLSGRRENLLVASHLSREKGHRMVLEELGLGPLFDFDLNYGEGLGAAIGLFLCELAFLCWRKIVNNC